MPARKSYQQYTVVRGDTLAAIAKRFGTTVNAIAVTSGIADPNRINVGQVLSIPMDAPADELDEVTVTAKPVPTRATLPDSSPGTPAGLASWFQPPKLWFTLGVLATMAYAIWRGPKR